MKCYKCDEEFDDAFPFCPHCGAASRKGKSKCPYCAEWIESDATKCCYCDETLDPEESLKSSTISAKSIESPSNRDRAVHTSARKKPQRAIPASYPEKVAEERKRFTKYVLSAIFINIALQLGIYVIARALSLTADEAEQLSAIPGLFSLITIVIVVYSTVILGKVLHFKWQQWVPAFLLFFLCYWGSFVYMLDKSNPKRIHEDFLCCPSCGNDVNEPGELCSMCVDEVKGS